MKDFYRKGNAVYSRERGLLWVDGNRSDAAQSVRLLNKQRAQQSLHPTSGSLPDLQAVSTPQPLVSSQAVSTPPTCG